MSTLEKAIVLLQTMPEQTLEAVYAMIQSMAAQPAHSPQNTAFGIAHKYADPSLIEKERGDFENAMVEKHAAH